MVPNERRARGDDPERKAVSPKERALMVQMVREFEARVDLAMEKGLKAAGIDDAGAHRAEHLRFGAFGKEFEDVLLPYIRSQHDLTKKRIERLEKLKDHVLLMFTGGAFLFVLLCVYYGASFALQHMVGK